MKKILCLLIVWIGVLSTIQAQQRPQFTQYFMNPYLLNPAFTGVYDYMDLRTGFRNQWTGFEDAPKSFYLSGNLPSNLIFNRKSKSLPAIGPSDYGSIPLSSEKNRINQGLGGMFIYDQTGAMSRLMLYASYAIHFNLNKAKTLKASLGVHGGFIQYRQNNSSLNPLDPDPALGTDVNSSLIPDVAIGALVRAEKFYIGFAANQVLQNKLSFSDVNLGQENQMYIHAYLTGGYQLKLNDRITFIPSATFKMLKASPISVDVNGLFDFQLGSRDKIKHFWLGASYRQLDAFSGIVGFGLTKMIDLNYSYDYTFRDISAFNSGTHEISLGFKLKNKNFLQNFNLFTK